MSSSSDSKIILITGAGTGIGKACGLALAAAGFTVVFSGRRQALLDEAAAAAGGKCAGIAVDVTAEASVVALFAEVQRRFGRLDVLFNNAGMNVPAVPLEELTAAQIRSVVDTNLVGSLLCCREALKLMKRQSPSGGRIINNGSLSAHAPRPNSAPYTSSKHAITGLTKALSLDARKYGIAVSQVDIGNVNSGLATRMAKGVLQADGSTKPEPTYDVRHLTGLLVYLASLPPDTNVPQVTLMATAMPFAGRG